MSLVLLSADASSMTRAGYPAIATVGGFFIFFYTLYYAAAKTGYGGWRNHSLWFFTNFFLWLFGLFLVFGPDQLIGVNLNNTLGPNGTSTFGGTYGNGFASFTVGPRAAIIGLQLMTQAAIGVFAVFSANAYAALVFGMFGVFNELCLIGSLFFFNYNQPIWLLDPVECNLYFKATVFDNITRCHDTGYLEFLRIIGVFAILLNALLIVISLLAYATAVPAAYHPANTGAVPAGAAGAPYGATSTTAAGYPTTAQPYGTAGPGFVAQQAPANTTVVSQPTYTTTTTANPQYTTATTAGVPATTTY